LIELDFLQGVLDFRLLQGFERSVVFFLEELELLDAVDLLLKIELVVWMGSEVGLVRARLSVRFPVVLQDVPVELGVCDGVRKSKVPGVKLVFFVSLPEVYQIFGVSDCSNSLQGVVTGEHSVLALVKLVDAGLHRTWRAVDWHLVMVCQQLDEMLCFLLLDVFLPDAKHVDSAALIVRTCKGVLVVSVALAVKETHQATLLEHVVSSDSIDNCSVAWHSFEVRLSHQAFVLFLKLVVVVLFSFNRVKLSASLLL